jgi:hypothetical protein
MLQRSKQSAPLYAVGCPVTYTGMDGREWSAVVRGVHREGGGRAEEVYYTVELADPGDPRRSWERQTVLERLRPRAGPSS